MLFPKTDALNWSVREENLFTQSGIAVEKKAIIRNDNNAVLNHAVGLDYVPYQNEELIELLERITRSTGLDVARSGFFGNGEKVFIQLKSENLKLGTDRVEGFVTGINSFDGSTSLGFGASNVTISCANTFFAAYRNLDKVRHTKNMKLNIESILRELDIALVEEQNIFASIKAMAEAPITDALREKVARKLFDIKPEFNLNSEDISTKKRNLMSTYFVDSRGEIAEKGANLWGLFSGVTKYTTHHISGDSTERKLFTKTGSVERAIFEDLAMLVK
jgi:hypothetical protein